MSIFFDVLRAISDMRAEDMPSAHRLVLLMVANHANALSRSWPSIGLLHGETGFGRTKIAEVLDELVTYGWLVPDGREGRGFKSSARYVVQVGRPWPEDSRVRLARPVERLRAALSVARPASDCDPPGEQRGDDAVIRPAGNRDPRGEQREGAPESASVIRPASNSDPPIVARAADHSDPPGGQEPPRSLLQELPKEPPRESAREGLQLQNPEPPRPKKRPATGKGSGKPTALPDGWTPKPAHLALGGELRFDRDRVVSEAGRFTDHAAAKGLTYIDWDAAFRTWLRNQRKYDDERGARTSRVPFRPSRGFDMPDEDRPLDSDFWPEAELVKFPTEPPPPPPREPRVYTPAERARQEEIRKRLEGMTPAQIEAELQRVSRSAGYGPEVFG